MPISSEDSSDWSHISASSVALRSENPIRQIVDGVMSSKSTNKARKVTRKWKRGREGQGGKKELGGLESVNPRTKVEKN